MDVKKVDTGCVCVCFCMFLHLYCVLVSHSHIFYIYFILLGGRYLLEEVMQNAGRRRSKGRWLGSCVGDRSLCPGGRGEA